MTAYPRHSHSLVNSTKPGALVSPLPGWTRTRECLLVWTVTVSQRGHVTAPAFHHVAKVAVVGAIIEQAEPEGRHGRTLRHVASNLRDTFQSAHPPPPTLSNNTCVSYLYVAAGSRGRGDYGEVNCLHLANCWRVIGLDAGWSHWAQLDGKKAQVWDPQRFRPGTSLCKMLTWYDPMALICDTMAVWTWGHGTPTSLSTAWKQDISTGHLSQLQHPASCTRL